MSTTGRRSGFTLIELIVVIAILALMTSVVGLAIEGAAPLPAVDDIAARASAARKQSIRLRKPVSISVPVDGRMVLLTAMPDGRVVADSSVRGPRLPARDR